MMFLSEKYVIFSALKNNHLLFRHSEGVERLKNLSISCCYSTPIAEFNLWKAQFHLT